MKKTMLLFAAIISWTSAFSGVLPLPVVARGIYTKDKSMVSMASEVVRVDMYMDSIMVECHFRLVNRGDDVTIEIGLPQIRFEVWESDYYNPEDKSNFQIYVNGDRLGDNALYVPAEMQDIYEYHIRRDDPDRIYMPPMDSIYNANHSLITELSAGSNIADTLFKSMTAESLFTTELIWSSYNIAAEHGYPWYVWEESFSRDEEKTVKVLYKLPTVELWNGGRSFNYSPGASFGWHGPTANAQITVRLNDGNIDNIEQIYPEQFIENRADNTVKWIFDEWMPGEKEDIFLQYFYPELRTAFQKEIQQKRRKDLDLEPKPEINFEPAIQGL